MLTEVSRGGAAPPPPSPPPPEGLSRRFSAEWLTGPRDRNGRLEVLSARWRHLPSARENRLAGCGRGEQKRIKGQGRRRKKLQTKEPSCEAERCLPPTATSTAYHAASRAGPRPAHSRPIEGEAWKQETLTNGPADSDVDGKQHAAPPSPPGPPNLAAGFLHSVNVTTDDLRGASRT